MHATPWLRTDQRLARAGGLYMGEWTEFNRRISTAEVVADGVVEARNIHQEGIVAFQRRQAQE